MADYSEKSELKGVGGWLALLIAILALVSPIIMVAQTIASTNEVRRVASILGSNSGTYITAMWIIIALASLGSFMLGIMLTMVHRWSTVRIAIAGLWGIAILTPLADLAVSAALFPAIVGGVIPVVLTSMARSSISAALWTAYLLRSKRVENTYTKGQLEAQRIFG